MIATAQEPKIGYLLTTNNATYLLIKEGKAYKCIKTCTTKTLAATNAVDMGITPKYSFKWHTTLSQEELEQITWRKNKLTPWQQQKLQNLL